MPADSGLDDEKAGQEKKRMLQMWLDQNQYTRNGILRYERIFGRTFVSVGGETTTREFTAQLQMEPGMKVLDIGCGAGGSAFFMARNYGVDVQGIDLSTNMVAIAQDYRAEMEAEVKHRVQFNLEDVTLMSYPENFFDVVYSRDCIMHIEDKESLFRSLLHTLKPGGKLMVSDYCYGEQEHSPEFKEYVKKRDYRMPTVKGYGEILKKVGFTKVVAADKTSLMVDMLKTELKKFALIRDKFVEEFSVEDYDWIVDGWKDKLVWCPKGEYAWGLMTATKPSEWNKYI